MAYLHEGMKARPEVALELADLAVEMYEAKVRRDDPGLTEEEVASRVATWRRTRPGAEWGDAMGRRIPWPPAPSTSE